jgi:selenocysteine lyase/cysteine desulfurase
MAGLCAGVIFMMEHFEDIRLTEHELSTYLLIHLYKISHIKVYTPMGLQQTGVVSFNIGDIPSGTVADELDRHDIACRAGIHCAPLVHRMLGTEQQGAVRLSMGYFNKKTDLDKALSIIHQIAQTI